MIRVTLEIEHDVGNVKIVTEDKTAGLYYQDAFDLFVKALHGAGFTYLPTSGLVKEHIDAFMHELKERKVDGAYTFTS